MVIALTVVFPLVNKRLILELGNEAGGGGGGSKSIGVNNAGCFL